MASRFPGFTPAKVFLPAQLLALGVAAAIGCGDDKGGGGGASAELAENDSDGGVGGGASGTEGDGGGATSKGGLAIGQQVPFPTTEWTVREPAEMGMDPALLEQACDYALNFDGNGDGTPDMNTQGVVIVRGGALVHECYASDKGPSDYGTSWSAAKSFTSTLIGIAIDEGLIESVDVPMSTFFPEWANDERREITLRDVLWMQSGLDFTEEYVDVSSEIVQLFNAADANQFVRDLPVRAPAGSNWYYSSGDTQLLGAVIETVTKMPAGDYAQAKIFDPIGMDAAQWWKDGSGHTAAYCCLDAPTRQYAKFGLLALREGNWDGTQVVSSDWIREATQTTAPNNPGYAYQWWTQGSLKEDIPQYPDLYWADGLDQQKIYVIPSLDLVVAKNTLYNKPAGPPKADPGSGVLSRITPRGLGTYGTVGPLVWEDVALLSPIINSIDGATEVPFTPTQLGARDPDPALCRTEAQEGYGSYCEEVHGCACDGCSAQFLDCNTSEACSAIVNCALEQGCRGIECLTPCNEVIQQYGGAATGNIAVEMALQLSECTVTQNCALSCP